MKHEKCTIPNPWHDIIKTIGGWNQTTAKSPYKEHETVKVYWTVGQVASELGVATSCIRFWEREFDLKIKRVKNQGIVNRLTGGKPKMIRKYTRKDVAKLREIHYLLKVRGFTLRGAKQELNLTN